ncbi:hypothetical protein ACM66B_003407 [Microbotryomycetes sp. NB124-2]
MPGPSPSPGASIEEGQRQVRPSPSRSPSISSLLNPSPAPDQHSRTGNDLNGHVTEAHHFFDDATEAQSGAADDRSASVSQTRHSSSHKRQRTASPPAEARAQGAEGSMLPPKMSRRDSAPRPSSSSGRHSATDIDTHHGQHLAALPGRHPSPSPATSRPLPAPPPQTREPPKLQRLEPSIFGIEPLDEFTREVADWMWSFVKTLPWRDPDTPVEVEAKIGMLMTAMNKPGEPPMRINVPVAIETILVDDSWTKFEASMSKYQFDHYHHLLNEVVHESESPSNTGAKMRYSHRKEVDSFHESDVEHPSHQRRVRVTKDYQTNKVLNVIRKVRVADMAVYSPKRQFDWRLSVNVEARDHNIPDAPVTIERVKDRRSYDHQICRVDLTQVDTTNRGRSSFELELEFRDARKLFEEADKEEKGLPNVYLDMVQTFLNSIRMLTRNAP